MTPFATVHSTVLLCKQSHEAQCVIGLLLADTSLCLADLRLLMSYNAVVLLWLIIHSVVYKARYVLVIQV